MAKIKRGTRTRRYIKIQQHAFTDGDWSFATTHTFGQEIINAPCPKEVKMPSAEPFD